MSLASGRLRHRVAIQQYVEQADTSGNVIQDQTTGEVTRAWETVATVWANIRPLSAREFIQSSATQSRVAAVVEMRQRSGLTPDMRLVHMVNGVAGTIYNPEGFLPDADSGLESLSIPCSTGVSNGQ